MAAIQGAPMLSLRIAVTAAQCDRNHGAFDKAARRLDLALRSIPENDGSADLLAAHQLAKEIELEAGAEISRQRRRGTSSQAFASTSMLIPTRIQRVA